ncbi:Quinone oxidoreductase, partial [Caligus rogercresseyi]
LPELPYTPGSDATGYIDALGPDLPSQDSGLAIGERVFVTGRNSGAYADYIVVESMYVFKLHKDSRFFKAPL